MSTETKKTGEQEVLECEIVKTGEQTQEESTELKVLNETELASVENLKKIAETGADGQYIVLLDVANTKEVLKGFVKKYKSLKVTKENYTKEAKEAEQVFRNSRLALQKIHKKNNAFINKVKTEKKTEIDELIEIIKPLEESFYAKIKVFKDEIAKAKKAEKQAEEDRIEKIKKALADTELGLEKSIAGAKTKEDLKKYDDFLKNLEGRVSDFAEFDFNFKRLLTIFKARRSEVVANVEKNEKIETQLKEIEQDKAKKEALKERVMAVRVKTLVGLGFKNVGDSLKLNDLEVKKDSFKDLDELEYFDFLEGLKDDLSKLEAKKNKEKVDNFKKARKVWSDLLEMYKKAGGKEAKLFSLRKDEIPSEKDLEQIKTLIKSLQETQKAKMLKEVLTDIKPVRDGAVRFLEDVDNIVEKAKFKHENSKPIIENFKGRLEDLINEVFGGVYDKK